MVGVAGRAYFLQLSEDFLTWTYFPDIIELGGYEPVTYFFDFSGFDQLFVRLKHLAFPGLDPGGEDFDGDKVSTQY